MKPIVMITTLWLAIAGFSVEAVSAPGGTTLAEDERRLWDQAVMEQNRILQSGRVLEDHHLQEYLRGVIGHLRPPESPAHLAFQTIIIRSSRVDAVAYPNGFLCINTGILARLENEAQLAALLAHEMSHCILRHSIRALRGERKGSSAGPFAAAAGEGPPLTSLRSTGASPLGLEYPQRFEAEADRMALQLLRRSGYDGREGLALFQLLLEGVDWEKMDECQRSAVRAEIQKRQEAWREALKKMEANRTQGIRNNGIFLKHVGTALMANVTLELRAGNFDDALQQLHEYMAHDGKNAHAHFLLGELFRQRAQPGDTQEAMFCYQRAIALNPHLAGAHQKIGLIHFKEGRNALAREAFQTSLRLDPGSPDNAYILSYMSQCAIQN